MLLPSAQPHPPAASPAGLTGTKQVKCCISDAYSDGESLTSRTSESWTWWSMMDGCLYDYDQGSGQCASLRDWFIHPSSAFHLDRSLRSNHREYTKGTFGRANRRAGEALRLPQTLLPGARLCSGGAAGVDTFCVAVSSQLAPSRLDFWAACAFVIPAHWCIEKETLRW